jgi:zinc protease
MKNIALNSIWTGVFLAFFTQSCWAGIPIAHWKQASGVSIYLVESQAVPMLDVQIDFDAGARRDPAAQAGLASVTASMAAKGVLARGKDKALNENELSEAWADLGAMFGANATSDRMSFALRTLTYPDLLAQAISLAARQLGQPAFPADVWLRERSRLGAALREAKNRPATVAARSFAKAVYGEHPYGFEMTEETLANIEVADMRALHARLIQPCRAKVSIVGAINRTQADALVRQLFSQLALGSGGCVPLPKVAEVSALTAPKEVRTAFDSTQAHVLIGQPGYKRDDPDFYSLTVGNYILGGGGFVSRLTTEVREKRGLSYSVYSYFTPGLHAGAFMLGLQTRPDQADQAVQVARSVLTQFVALGPNAQELQAAKDNLIGGFALRIDSNRKLLDNVANIAWNNLPLNYLDTWTQRVERVTLEDIGQAFKRKLQPQTLVTVVVGGLP